MSRKDGVLALLVVVVWGLNFVVIKVGLHNMQQLIAGRFALYAGQLTGYLFCRTTERESTTEFAAGVWINHQFCAVCFSCAINFGMPAGLASLVLQAQAFFTIVLGAFLFRGAIAWQTIGGDRLSNFRHTGVNRR